MKLIKLKNEINYKDKIIKAKIINVKGSSPNKVDDIILVSHDTIFGTIGGGNLEYLIVEEAKNILKSKIKTKILSIPLGPGIGQCCGGYVQIKLSLHKNSSDALKNENLNILR